MLKVLVALWLRFFMRRSLRGSNLLGVEDLPLVQRLSFVLKMSLLATPQHGLEGIESCPTVAISVARSVYFIIIILLLLFYYYVLF